MTGIVRKDSIEELCGHRDAALSLYAQAFELFKAARAAHARACVGYPHISAAVTDPFRFIRAEDGGARYAGEVRPHLDRDMWRALLVNTKLGSLMDEQERKAFDKGLENPPEISAETVFATLSRLAAEGDAIFRRGMVEAFRSLSNDYRSHDGFKIGPRMVVRRVVDVTPFRGDKGKRSLWVRLSTSGEQRLQDVDRVLHILDGKAPPERLQGICQAMREAIPNEGMGPGEAETPYMRVRYFQNGNGHLWILRDDLREKANLLIAEHYGAALGDNTNRRAA
jgi:hypothetical protein